MSLAHSPSVAFALSSSTRSTPASCKALRTRGKFDLGQVEMYCAALMYFSSLSVFSAASAAAVVVTYAPVLRIAGSTSLVTQRLNFLAFGSLLDSMREYKPLSLMMCAPKLPVFKVGISPTLTSRLSSISTWRLIASAVSLYPKAVATSLPTNQGASSIMIVRIAPNSELLKVCNSFMPARLLPL